jgi:hypothetical protein
MYRFQMAGIFSAELQAADEDTNTPPLWRISFSPNEDQFISIGINSLETHLITDITCQDYSDSDSSDLSPKQARKLVFEQGEKNKPVMIQALIQTLTNHAVMIQKVIDSNLKLDHKEALQRVIHYLSQTTLDQWPT